MENFDFKAKKLCKRTWMIEGDGCTSYVLEGNNDAIMIDNGYGVYDIRSFAERLIGRNIHSTINTHGHFDHGGGNGLFDKVYLAKAGESGAKTPYPSFKGVTFPKNFFDYQPIYVCEGDIIELGSRSLEIIDIPSHSPGDIAILDKEQRLLFVGDNAGKHVMLMYQQDDPQPTIEQYALHLNKLISYYDEFDYILSGHGTELEDKSLLKKLLANAEHILGGNEGMPFPTMDGHDDGKEEDGPREGDFVMYLPEYKRMSIYEGVGIGYDCRYVRNRK